MPDKKEEGSGELTTGVDQLLELLKKEERVSLEDATKELGVSMDVVQSWVDFLVEEQIVGIEYKFTKPFIYMNETEEGEGSDKGSETESMDSIKDEFMEKAQDKNIPEKNLHGLWKNHVEKALENKKNFFWREASKRDLQAVQRLWEEYRKKLLGEQLGT